MWRDRTAFGVLYARYSHMAHGILLARVPFSVVDDLVQDVFSPGFAAPQHSQRNLAFPRMAGRFLEPILSSMIQKSTEPARTEQLEGYLEDVARRLYATAKN